MHVKMKSVPTVFSQWNDNQASSGFYLKKKDVSKSVSEPGCAVKIKEEL